MRRPDLSKKDETAFQNMCRIGEVSFLVGYYMIFRNILCFGPQQELKRKCQEMKQGSINSGLRRALR